VRFISSTYDQENRLIRVTTANGNRSEFSYDGMSRRVETREYQAGSLASTTRYLYDGLLPIAELDTSNAVTRTITRGTDLSGSMQGAGGIGGILATNGNEYSYDGNGNVRDIISASGLNVAHYEYDPFGNKTASSGSYSSQPYQWSSKEFHQPCGMVYYLYRFYNPVLGRWVNRDPIEEAGGINMFGFVSNSPVRLFDPLGLEDKSSCSSTDLLSGDLVIFGGPGFSFRVLRYFGKCKKPCVVLQICFRASIGMMAGIGGWTNKSILKNVDETSDTESGVNSSAQIGPITLQRNDGGINCDDSSSSGKGLASELGIGAIWGAEKCITISQSGEGCQ